MRYDEYIIWIINGVKMTASPRVFISFSSRDLISVRKLFYRLKSQNVNVWDYSQRGDEIPWGKDIPRYLKQQIDASDFFIVLVSENSVNPTLSPYTKLELAYVIEKDWHTQGRILPLVLLNNPPRKWYNEFKVLNEIMRLDLNPDETKQFEETIAKISRFLNVPYVSPFLSHTRLPFSERFQTEIKQWGLSISLHEELMLIIDTFYQQYAANDFLSAKKTISYFLLACFHRIPKLRPYYPLIVKGVCELHLGKFLEAEETFLEAIKHPLQDENAYGGLGQVYFRQHRFEEALQAFDEALKLCPVEFNREILFNKLGAEIELGHAIKNISFLDSFDLSKLTKEEWLNFFNMKGIAHYKRGEITAAIEIFNDMRMKKRYNAATVIYNYLALKELGNIEKSINLLQTEAVKFPDITLYHYLAQGFWQLHRDKESISIYEQKILKMKPHFRQFWIEYARMLKLSSQKKMKSVCLRVLDQRYFPLPTTKEDFFYDGFANFLLEKHQRAFYDFERSKNYCEYYYDQVLEFAEAANN